jgi:hypothetical protein
MGAAREAGLEYTEQGEPKGFDSQQDISLSSALCVVMHLHPSAKPETVRKFIVGIAIQSTDSGMLGYAERFEESYVRLDRKQTSVYRSSPERFAAIPTDFWRISMAVDENAKASFAADAIDHHTEMTASELPYRIRDSSYGELQSDRVRLSQIAKGIHFPLEKLIALARDAEWQAWGGVAAKLERRGKRGRPQTWKWDEVKSALTIEAARNPEILQGGAGGIVQFINDEMRRLHHEQIPDRKEVDDYVRHFSSLWAPPAAEPPAE